MSEQQTSLMTDDTTITDSTASGNAEESANVEAAQAASAGEQQASATEDKAGKGDDSVVPEEYADFSFEDGKGLPDEVVADIKDAAKDMGLTQVQAQKLAERQVKAREAAEAAQQEAVKSYAEQWSEEARNDKEFGGEKFDANLATAKKALDAYGSDTFKQLLNVSGMGNHPEFIRFCLKAGQQMSEDGHVSGGTPGAKAGNPQSLYRASNMNP